MRRARFAAVALAIAGTAGPGQVQGQHATQIGLRGGVSVASASFDDDTFDEDNRTGFTGGLFLDVDRGVLGFQVAGLYSAKGVETGVGDLDLKYIEIPAVLKLGLPLAIVKPSVFGGAALALRTGCEIDGVECTEDAFKSTDLLGVVGADVGVYLGDVSLWADARYHIGLSDINDVTDVFGDLKNRNWNLTAGAGIKL